MRQETAAETSVHICPSNSTSYGGIADQTGSEIQIGNQQQHSDSAINSNIPALSCNVNTNVRRSKIDKAPLLPNDQLARSNSVSSIMQQTPGIQSTIRTTGLSTISGVFAPVALSMFSVLLFLRMGFVVGQSGVLVTILQLILAYAIVMLTVLSLCAISTNGAIEGGGVYYMISRALGPEFGGSIGVLFFMANVFSCALYISGFTEALINNFGDGGTMLPDGLSHGLPTTPPFPFLYGVLVSFLLLLICLIGASLFANTSLALLLVVGGCYLTFLISLVIKSAVPINIPKSNVYIYSVPINNSDPYGETIMNVSQIQTRMYTSFSLKTLQENLFNNYTHDYTTNKDTNFALVFAIVFSGVTGIMAGANMSGELARPDVSIPRGTLQAIGFTLLVYFLTCFLLGSTCSRSLLQNDYTVMLEINVWPPFILIAIFSTTLFSSMSNLIGASRVLSRLGEDRPATVYLGDRNPVLSVFISWFLSVGVLLIGSLNRIAQVTSIFFLLSYMGVNLACLALELTSAPNFRPTFKCFSWHSAALGVGAAVGMMLLVDAATSAIAIILLLLLLMTLHYQVLYFHSQAPIGSWGSISQALMYHQVRKYLLLLDSRKDHVKYWRPQILLLVNRPASSCHLIDFVNDLKKSGLYVLGHVKKGTMDDFQMDPLHHVYPYWLGLVDYMKVKSFVELTVNDSVRLGIEQLVRISGLGAMKPNTVVLGFHDSQPRMDTLSRSGLMQGLRSAKIDKAEVVEYFTADDYPPREIDDGEGRLSTVDYVRVIHDILKMNKNICLARHFHALDKEAIFRNGNSGRKCYVDVWPVDMLKPGETGWGWDNSCLFLLQLACILSMVSGWKSRTTLRVFLCVTSLQDMHRRERQLELMLDQLRIFAKSIVIPWDHVICHLSEPIPNAPPQDAANMPDTYLKAMNEMMKKNSSETAVIFFNMPIPPIEEHKYEQYMQKLETLTSDLPPFLLVHGLASVISTAL